jgi:hypothetical protein
VAGCGECGDEPSGSCATELVIITYFNSMYYPCMCLVGTEKRFGQGSQSPNRLTWDPNAKQVC